jgi:hypothetical protein
MISPRSTPPATVAGKHHEPKKKESPVPTKRPRIQTEQECQEPLSPEEEAFQRAQNARMNRMVMIGFWESRRTSFPSLYRERFPNGIDNADL